MTRVSPPVTNITMPVFGRPEETLVSIASIRKHTRSRFILTVVDNGNGGDFSKELARLADEGVIDNLFILDRNYGCSPACNVGWALVDAPFYMKMDNDYEILEDTWLDRIYGMWGRDRHTTLMGPAWGCDMPIGRVETAYGVKWTIPISFMGSAFLVSKKVSDAIGFFSEDYGLYGDEDADYCLRCHHAGIRKYSFAPEPFIRIIGNDEKEADYAAFKQDAHEMSVGARPGQGILALNFFLYETGLRALNVPRKYAVSSVRGRHVTLAENPAYAPYYDKLMRCLDLFNARERDPGPAEVEAMRRILA